MCTGYKEVKCLQVVSKYRTQRHSVYILLRHTPTYQYIHTAVAVLPCTLGSFRMCICYTRQIEMMNNYPPQLLAALGFPPDALQTEFLKHKRLGKLKVQFILVTSLCTMYVCTYMYICMYYSTFDTCLIPMND